MTEKQLSPDEPLTIYTTTDFYEAEIIKNALEAEEIRCDLDGERQAGLAEVLPIGLVVRARDADRARKIIDRHSQRDQV